MKSLDEILSDVTPAAKVASAPSTLGDAVRQLSSALSGYRPEGLTLEGLNAVKEAGFRSAPPSPQTVQLPSNEGLGSPLRKMAAAVRMADEQEKVASFKKHATALRAIRGLTLLRERNAP